MDTIAILTPPFELWFSPPLESSLRRNRRLETPAANPEKVLERAK